MSAIHEMIDSLRKRPDLSVGDGDNAWELMIPKGRDFLCKVTVPHRVLEWFACVWHRREKRDVWSDWMDYSGYDDRTRAKLEAEMAQDILSFVNRVSISFPLELPLKIYEEGRPAAE